MSNRWIPQPKQEIFLKNPAYECGFGGSKGPGKTDALIVDGSSQLIKPGYKAILFRRTYKQLADIILRTHKFFHSVGAWSGDDKCWRFKGAKGIQPQSSGTTVGVEGSRFYVSHCQHEKDKENHQGQEYHWIGFDQLEQFSQTMYEYLKMQARSTNPNIQCYIRASFNPGGIGHAWVKKHFVDACPRDGTVRSFIKVNDEYKKVSYGTPDALTRAFVFSVIHDNRHIIENDPQYLANLRSLPEKLRVAMEDGDWDHFDGQFFEMWRKEHHVIAYSEYLNMCKALPVARFISGDYGFVKQSAIGWFAVFPDSSIVQYRELYKGGYTYPALQRKIMEMTPEHEKIEYQTMDPAIQGDKQHHKEEKEGEAKGTSGLDEMEKVCDNRWPILLADNRRVVGWTQMREALTPRKNQFDVIVPRLRYTENCSETIRTIPTLIHDDADPEDVNTEGEDHLGDMNRYAIMSRAVPPAIEKPPETTKDMFWNKVKEELKKSNNSGQDSTEGYNLDEDDFITISE